MSVRLYHEFVLSGDTAWKQFVSLMKANAKAYIERGTPIRLIVTTEDRRRTLEANAHYWGYVLRTIAEQAWVNEQQFSADTWHEYYANLYCPKIEIVLPTGEIFTRRKSTSEMGQKEFAEYVTRVQSNAAQEHEVEFTNGF